MSTEGGGGKDSPAPPVATLEKANEPPGAASPEDEGASLLPSQTLHHVGDVQISDAEAAKALGRPLEHPDKPQRPEDLAALSAYEVVIEPDKNIVGDAKDLGGMQRIVSAQGPQIESAGTELTPETTSSIRAEVVAPQRLDPDFFLAADLNDPRTRALLSPADFELARRLQRAIFGPPNLPPPPEDGDGGGGDDEGDDGDGPERRPSRISEGQPPRRPEGDPRDIESLAPRDREKEPLPSVEVIIEEIADWYKLRERDYDAAYSDEEIGRLCKNFDLFDEYFREGNAASDDRLVPLMERQRALEAEAIPLVDSYNELMDRADNLAVDLLLDPNMRRTIRNTTRPGQRWDDLQRELAEQLNRNPTDNEMADWLSRIGQSEELIRILDGMIPPAPDGFVERLSDELGHVPTPEEIIRERIARANDSNETENVPGLIVLREITEDLREESGDPNFNPTEEEIHRRRLEIALEGGELRGSTQLILLSILLPNNHPDIQEIRDLLAEVESHRITGIRREEAEILERRDEIVRENLGLTTADQTEERPVERLPQPPDRSFEEAMALMNNARASAAEREEGRRDVLIYLELADRFGLLDTQKGIFNTQYGNYQRLMQPNRREGDTRDPVDPGVLLRGLRRRLMNTEEFENELDDAEDEGFDTYARLARRRAEAQGIEFDEEQFGGVIRYYTRQGYQSLVNFLQYSTNPEAAEVNIEGRDSEVLRRVWNWRERQGELNERRRAARQFEKFWEPTGSGFYAFTAETAEEFEIAANSHIELIKSGALKKDPSTVLREIEYFSTNLTQFALRIPGMDRDRISAIRRRYEVEATAYLGEQFNRSYDMRNMIAIYQKLNDTHEGMDHWREAAKLRNGLVYRARMIQKSPEYEMMYRAMGPHGQQDRRPHAQLYMIQLMRKRLAKDLVGEVISDRHITLPEGVVIGGARGTEEERQRAIAENLDSLGLDQPITVHERAYVESTEQLLTRVYNLTQLVAEGLPIELEKTLATIFSPREVEALRIRDIKARVTEGQSIIPGDNSQMEAALWQVIHGRQKPAQGERLYTPDEKKAYEQALKEAEEAVTVFMQLNSITGDKSVKGGPSVEGNARKALKPTTARAKALKERLGREPTKQELAKEAVLEIKERLGPDATPEQVRNACQAEMERAWTSLEVETADKISYEMVESFGIYAVQRAKMQVAEYNRTHPDSPIRRSDPRYRFFIELVRLNAIEQIAENGWKAKLLEYDLDKLTNEVVASLFDKDKKLRKSALDHSGAKIRQAGQVLVKEGSYLKDITKKYKGQDVNIIVASKSIFGRYVESTYAANQFEIHKQITDPAVTAAARRILSGESDPEDEDFLATYRLMIDPTLDTITQFNKAQQKGEEMCILAACQGSWADRLETRRAASIRFADLTEYEIPNFDGATKRRFNPDALANANPDRWSPRGRWIASRLLAVGNGMGKKLGLEDFFDVTRLIKRRFKHDEDMRQQIIDGPLLASLPQGYSIDDRLYGLYFGSESQQGDPHSPGLFEKFTRSAEKLLIGFHPYTHTVLEGVVTDGGHFTPARKPNGELEGAYWKDGKQVNERTPGGIYRGMLTFEKESDQKQFIETLQQILDTPRAIEEVFKMVSENTTATGAWDLRYRDVIRWDEEGPVLQEDPEAIDTNQGVRRAKSVGRAAYMSALFGDDVLDYMTRFRLPDATGEHMLPGAGYEYKDEQSYFGLIDTVRIKISWLSEEDKKYFPEYADSKGEDPRMQGPTIREFILSKWRRR